MTELKTKKSLLEALARASSHTPTAEEIQKQRESFILGSLKPDILSPSHLTRVGVQVAAPHMMMDADFSATKA